MACAYAGTVNGCCWCVSERIAELRYNGGASQCRDRGARRCSDSADRLRSMWRRNAYPGIMGMCNGWAVISKVATLANSVQERAVRHDSIGRFPSAHGFAERSLSYGILLPAVMPIMKKIRQTTRKIKNRNLATPAAATAMPVNPNTAATNAITKNITAQRNKFLPPSRGNRTAQPLRVPLNRYCYASSLKFLELAAQEPNLRRWRYQNVCFATTASDCAVATPAGFFVLLKGVPWGLPGCRLTTGKRKRGEMRDRETVHFGKAALCATAGEWFDTMHCSRQLFGPVSGKYILRIRRKKEPR